MIERLKKKLYKRLYGEINYYRNIGMEIGKGCSLVGKVNFGSEPYLISMGNDVRITDGVRFITHDGGVNVIRNAYNLHNIDKFGKIKIGNNVFIGTQSIIMPNVTVGNNVIIGAGSIVTKDINDNCVVAGVPAKKISTLEEYYQKNKEFFIETKKLNEKERKNMIISYINKE